MAYYRWGVHWTSGDFKERAKKESPKSTWLIADQCSLPQANVTSPSGEAKNKGI